MTTYFYRQSEWVPVAPNAGTYTKVAHTPICRCCRLAIPDSERTATISLSRFGYVQKECLVSVVGTCKMDAKRGRHLMPPSFLVAAIFGGTNYILSMDDNGATANRCRWVCRIGCAELIIVDEGVGSCVPYLHTELVDATASGRLPINGCYYERVGSRAIYGACAPELGARTCDYQPFVSIRMEVHIARLELELRVPYW